VQCPKRLYFEVDSPDLAGELDEASRAVIEQDEEAGRLARTTFPGGLRVETVGELDLRKTPKLTAAAVIDRVPALFEKTFEHDGVFVRTDSVERPSKAQFHFMDSETVMPSLSRHAGM
jgi:hypothetical protein